MRTLSFAAPAPLLNMNDRLHWAEKSRRVRAWRTSAAFTAHANHVRGLGRTLVAIDLPVRSLKVRRDGANFHATLKPVVDGLVDAGVWPDDTGTWVVTTEPTFHTGDNLVHIALTPVKLIAGHNVPATPLYGGAA